MAESRMGEEEAHCNPELEMIKEVRKNVNVTVIVTVVTVVIVTCLSKNNLTP